MEALIQLFTILITPIALLNTFGGIVSGIGLAIHGEWGIIAYGVLIFVIAKFIIGIAVLPALIFSKPATAMLERGNKFIGYALMLLSTIYTYGAITLWCVFIMAFFLEQSSQESVKHALIWSYCVATGPITLMAKMEQNEYAMISTFFIQVAYIISIGAIGFTEASLQDVLVIFAFIMTIGMAFQFYSAYIADKANGY